MKIRYIGANPTNTSFGIDFVKGSWVEVTDILACTKLSGNPSFEVMKGEEIEEADFKEFLSEKDVLLAKAEAMDIKIDKRWSVTKIKEALNGYCSGSEEEGSNETGVQSE